MGSIERPSPHFTWDEVTTKEGVPGRYRPHLTDAVRAALVRVCEVVEMLRADVGQSIRVTSGYRNGDAKQHGQGQALDIQINGMSPFDAMWRLRALDNNGSLPHPLRQVIAESNHRGEDSLKGSMGPGLGRWLHVAVLGRDGERYSAKANNAWMGMWSGGKRLY